MYTTDFDQRPSQPVVKSSLSARDAFLSWVKENNLQTIKDHAGLLWEVKIKTSEAPDPDDTHGLIWLADVFLVAQVDAEGLIHSGTLQEDQDARMIDLLGDDRITMVMGPRHVSAKQGPELEQKLIALMPGIRNSLEQQDLTKVKRSLIGRWIDRSRRFDKGLAF